MKNVVVTYTVKPERVIEHVGLIKAVFEQLASTRPAGLQYRVLALADGVSFVHVATHEDGANPLLELPAFVTFTEGISTRVTAPPVSSSAGDIGVYPAVS